MCGIAGYLSLDSGGVPPATLARMTSIIEHRGPDDSGFYEDSVAHLGHRRLSIIDLAAGHQPLCNETGSLWIVYNGEIFNHTVVRERLEKLGHVYRTHSDTETIVHAYEQWGQECPVQLRGMFAFAIWDTERQKLFCCRDRLGIKPLYYYWDGRHFVFGSEIKALLEHPAVPRRLEESLLAETLAAGYSSGEQTLFHQIRKLMPGHTLTVDAGSGTLDIKQYWEIPDPDRSEERSDESWIEEAGSRIEEAVRTRLMSDVPLGMFLSGGVDSSLIAAHMRRMVDGPVKTFAVGYRERAYSELDYARETAVHIGTEHHETTLGMEEFFELLPRLVWHEDEPIVWPSSISLYVVSRLAAQHVKVVLTGEGSDELFGGYSRYRFLRLNQRAIRWWKLLPEPLRRLSRDRIAKSYLLPAGLKRKLGHTFIGRGEDLDSLYLDNFYAAFAAEEIRALRPGLLAPYASFHQYWKIGGGSWELDRMLYADQKTYLVELLMKQDQMSMATSIESRVPFLDHPLVEFAARVPDRLKLRAGQGKYIVKKAAESLLPRRILYRPKMGFPTPLRSWLLDPRAASLFGLIAAPDSFVNQLLDRTAIDALIERHRGGREDATDRLWRLLNLEVWGGTFFLGRRGRYGEGWMRPAAAAV
jgi:asparagine synthase (glutamine-hydrolysing)